MNQHFQYTYDNTGHPRFLHLTFQYVVGRNNTVPLDFTVLPDLSWACEVTLNGQVCNKCYYGMCEDGFSSVIVDCVNVEEAGIVDICNPKRQDADGPLAVFAFQDPAILQGCPPRLLG
jgi:hypothetical protein